MEEVTTTEVTTEVSAPEATAPVEQSAGAEQGVELNAESVGQEQAAPAAPQFTPNYKLKVYDQEMELEDKFLKDLIKDADSEKKVKEIAQKYLGFDTIKSRHEKVKQEYQTFQQQAQPVMELYQDYAKLAQKGDLEGIFSLLKISEDMIFQYALQKAQQTPEQKQYEQHQRQLAQEKERLQSQNQTLEERQHQQLVQFRNQEMNWVLARPEVSSIAQEYDKRVGQPGAFKKAVVRHGLAHHAATGEDLSAEQAVQEVMKEAGAFVTPTNQPQAQAPQLIQQPNGQPPIIPNVSSRAVSPVKKQVRGIADLKKKYDELSGSSN